MNDLVPFAEKSLVDHGWFDPYGGTITMDTVIEHISVDSGDDPSTSEEIFDALLIDLRKGATEGAYLATAIFSNVQINIEDGQVYAINVVLEHVCGVCIDVYIPYRRIFDSDIEYGETIATEASPKVFDSPSES